MAMDTDGYLKALASPVSISQMNTAQLVTVSQASIYQLNIRQLVSASGASVAGFVGSGLNPIWRVSGALSGASTLLQPPIIMPQAGNWESFTFLTRTVASGVSAIVDVNLNGVSIFSAIGRPMIVAAGTFVSTASIATKAFNAGDKITLDYDGTGGNILDIIVQGRAI